MMEFFQQLPHLEPYGNPQYFVYVIAATLPIFIGLFFKKRFAWYEVLVSLFFIVTMLVGGKTNQLAALGIYLCWEILLLLFYKHYRKSKDGKWVFYLVSFLSLLPIIFVKVQPAINGTQSLLGFLGISYLTFRSVGIIIELRDGVIKDFTLWEFLRFLLFMPTFSSGPIDRFKRFNENYQAIPERDELMDMLDESVRYIMRGFLYKFILAHVLGETLLPPLKNLALQSGGFFNLYALAVMYTFGLELFFDFAGYSMFALTISNLMGIRSPINFNKPFLSRDLKEFWNRWHMSLSFWFRDFVFMRMVMVLTRKKVFKNRNVTSSMAYIVNMLIMGFWHGVTWYYIAYGLFHGLGLVINDAWVRKKKTLNKERKKAGKAALPENRWIQFLGMVVTFHVVMLSFLIFSGFLLESQGFTNIADFSKDGGEPFFMKDTIHLGWLGWLAFDKAVDPFLSNPTPAPTYHLNERFFSKDWATYDGDVKEFQ
ncbi:transport protein DltB [Streptococcus pneumoniae]|nr:transport protein DltB [Streptococcus pneumoniae]